MKNKNFCNNQLMKCLDLDKKNSMCQYYKALLIYNKGKDSYERCNSCIKECGETTI